MEIRLPEPQAPRDQSLPELQNKDSDTLPSPFFQPINLQYTDSPSPPKTKTTCQQRRTSPAR